MKAPLDAGPARTTKTKTRNNCHYHYSILTYIPTTIMMIAVSALPAEVVVFRVKLLDVGALVGGGLVVGALVGGVTSISSEYRTEVPHNGKHYHMMRTYT